MSASLSPSKMIFPSVAPRVRSRFVSSRVSIPEMAGICSERTAPTKRSRANMPKSTREGRTLSNEDTRRSKEASDVRREHLTLTEQVTSKVECGDLVQADGTIDQVPLRFDKHI